MSQCFFCKNELDADDPTTYRQVESWVTGPKLDSPVLREQTGRLAHKTCIENIMRGQAPDQPGLFDEEN